MADPTGAIRRYLYHGTATPYEGVPGPGRAVRTSTVVGSHWAADPAVANTFTGFADGPYPAPGKPWMGGPYDPPASAARIYRARHPGDDKFMVVPQDPKRTGDVTDDEAVDALARMVAYRKDPQLAVPVVDQLSYLFPYSVDQVIDRFNSGRSVPNKYGDRAYLGWADLFRREPMYADDVTETLTYGNALRDHLYGKGYMGLRYRNTFEPEIKNAKDPASYIVLDANDLKYRRGGHYRG